MEKSENEGVPTLESQLIEANKEKEIYRNLYNECNKKNARIKAILNSIGVLIINMEDNK